MIPWVLKNEGVFWIEGSTGQQRENSAQKYREEEKVLHTFGDTLCGSNKGLFLRQKVQLKNELGRNIGATTEKLCGSKEFPGSSLNYGLRRGVEVLC